MITPTRTRKINTTRTNPRMSTETACDSVNENETKNKARAGTR